MTFVLNFKVTWSSAQLFGVESVSQAKNKKIKRKKERKTERSDRSRGFT